MGGGDIFYSVCRVCKLLRKTFQDFSKLFPLWRPGCELCAGALGSCGSVMESEQGGACLPRRPASRAGAREGEEQERAMKKGGGVERAGAWESRLPHGAVGKGGCGVTWGHMYTDFIPRKCSHLKK